MLKTFFKLSNYLILVLLLILTALFLPGCNVKAKKQNFTDKYIRAFTNLQSEPEIAEEGKKAAIAYLRSGCTDLDSADIARESYEMSIEKDKASLKSIDLMKKPDPESEKIALSLIDGINKIDEASKEFALQYKNARKQTVEERIASSQDIQPILETIATGMTEIKNSLEKLITYIEENGLEGKDDVQVWLDNVTTQLEGVESNITR